jgi:hypothetical protein
MLALADGPDRARGAVEKLRLFVSGMRLKLLAAFSLAGLLVTLWVSTLGDFPIYQLIEDEAATSEQLLDVAVLRGERHRPFWRDNEHMAFIEPKNLAWTLNPSEADLDRLRDKGRRFLAVVDPHVDAPQSINWIRSHCSLLRSSWPQWLLAYNWFRWQDRVQWWELYGCAGR